MYSQDPSIEDVNDLYDHYYSKNEFVKNIHTWKKSKKNSYLRLKIVCYLITYLISDKVGHRNSVPLFKNEEEII